jgi:hypothetical protein
VCPRGITNSTAGDMGIFLGLSNTGLPATWSIKAKFDLSILHPDATKLIKQSELLHELHAYADGHGLSVMQW